MKVLYTKHAEEKLKRTDIRKLGITKSTIEYTLQTSEKYKTKYGDEATIGRLDDTHVLRVIYGIIKDEIKVITFHVARKGRYET